MNNKIHYVCIEKLKSTGISNEDAEVILNVLETSDEYGVTSHGLRMFEAHLNKFKTNSYNIHPSFEIIKQTPAFSVVDGDNACGFISAKYCMDLAVKKSKEVGIYHVLSRNNNTVGPAFYYPLLAAKQDCIGIIYSNSPAQMAPIGGKEKLLGTNPFSAVVPVPGKDPIIIDFATSVVAKSKFKEYKEQGKMLPNGWALDCEGNPTNDPDQGMAGLVQPMAGFKGYSISLLIDVLAGLMSGAAYLNNVGRFYSQDNKSMNIGFSCIAIDPQIVLGDKYSELINNFVDVIRNSEEIKGKTICLPGDDRISYRR